LEYLRLKLRRLAERKDGSAEVQNEALPDDR
jgi:hypothetical protein